MKLSYNRAVSDYFELVRHGEHRSCDRQLALCDFIERIFRTEKLRTDDALFEKYMNLEKYFPFKLFEWERFIFYLHNCVYREDGLLRFPDQLGDDADSSVVHLLYHNQVHGTCPSG